MKRGLEVKVGPEGRVLIPAEVRRAANMEPGTILIVRMDGDHVVLIPRDAIKRRLHEMFANVGGSMAHELISERLVELAHEDHTSQ